MGVTMEIDAGEILRVGVGGGFGMRGDASQRVEDGRHNRLAVRVGGDNRC